MTIAKPTLKQLQEKINLVMEAAALFNVGDRVHVGGHPATGELGTVTKTNGHGHAHVTTDSGAEHKFDKLGNSMSETNKHIKLRSPEAHEKAKADLDRQNAESRSKKEAADKISAAHVDANDPTHREIIAKLREHSSDPHLANLGSPVHKFDRHGNYNNSETESHVEPGEFSDLFHKVTKEVSIHNVRDDDTEAKESGITHHGRIEYRYEHPGGGSNGHAAGSFTRHSDGHIEIRQHVAVGTRSYGGTNWERKVVKHID